MAKTETKAVTKPKEEENLPATLAKNEVKISKEVPEWARGEKVEGTENLGAGDYEMPRIKLLQGLSEELEQFDGLKAGQFFHNTAERGLGSSLLIVPIYLSKRFVLWKPRHDGGGILARADDGVTWQPSSGEFDIKVSKDSDRRVKWKILSPNVVKSKLAEWGTYDPEDTGSQPAATECFVTVVGMPQYPELGPAVLMLQRTAAKHAKKFNSKMKMSSAAIYRQIYTMESFGDNNNAGQKFHNYQFAMNGYLDDKEMVEYYKGLYDKFKTEGVKISDKDQEDDGAPQADRSAEDAAKKETRY